MNEVIERKFHRPEPGLMIAEGLRIAGHASIFGLKDRGGDVVMPGAYAASLAALQARGERVRMLWQHDPQQPVGIWDTVREDSRGLWVEGRLLPEVARAREAAALIGAGAIDGLSIGYRVRRAGRAADGARQLVEVELWEVSLVTFPMQGEARLGGEAKGDAALLHHLAGIMARARRQLSRGQAGSPGDL